MTQVYVAGPASVQESAIFCFLFLSHFLSPPAFGLSISALCERAGNGTLGADEEHIPLKAVPVLPFPPFPVVRYRQRGKSVLEQAS